MAFLVGVFEGDFETWKQGFDSDPLGRKQVARGHTLFRGIDNPNEIFLRIESILPRRPRHSKTRYAARTCYRT